MADYRLTPFLLGEYIGEYSSRFSIHQGLQFVPAHGVIPLENAHGFMAGGRYDSEIVMAFNSPVVYEGVPQVVKGEVLDARLHAGGDGRPLLFLPSLA